jgi:hypothetical protein
VADLAQVRELISAHPDWSRYRLSRELCTLWDWRNGVGEWKDMAARTLLAKCAQRGWIELPALRRRSPNRHRLAAPPVRSWDCTAITSDGHELAALRLEEVSQHAEPRAEVRAALASFHYLGYRRPVGENLQYTVRNPAGRLLAVLEFSAAAWKCAPRDQWIGWSAPQREAGLAGVVNNSRFLILPWVQVSRLASWVLGRIARRIAADWQVKYGYSIFLLETFVEAGRFRGTCYRAANWQRLGSTTGRSRQDRHGTLRVPLKDVYTYPLRADFRTGLGVQ